ncbi:DUF2158 domain-containing protein [Methylobacterium trifolii]
MKIEVGSIVVLKSGGPTMTVASIEGEKAMCEWFNMSGNVYDHKWASFRLSSLKKTG